MSPTKVSLSLFAITLAIVFSASISEAKGSHRGGKGPVKATAEIQGCTNDYEVSGRAMLRERRSVEGVKQVDVSIFVKGLKRGKHAVHIHETAECKPCGDAAGHFDPGPNSNTSPDGNHPFHSGDLINIEANRRGNAHLNTTTTRVTLSPGPLSLFDDDGSAFIIHVDPDTYCPKGAAAGCAGGARAACGVIELED